MSTGCKVETTLIDPPPSSGEALIMDLWSCLIEACPETIYNCPSIKHPLSLSLSSTLSLSLKVEWKTKMYHIVISASHCDITSFCVFSFLTERPIVKTLITTKQSFHWIFLYNVSNFIFLLLLNLCIYFSNLLFFLYLQNRNLLFYDYF